ncbi:bifunctional adenosylcobinamide kinase/adenosylcobinamide-phosphate guanylyltransferase [Pueribacillus theae]|uniref:bifunctional adenosylcobinamide kinase/adenosylcobinamide-phosphate guanylyltransferase n=1 Tax=Pueribacillus theae TaxID=2171751 RepID=UPI001F0CADA2|nr:bifunctional adenosylcobinamide kinase/adenosylcobinamide-phosphate guanylyltransferase [Pueribacillus theae]
MFGGAFNGKSNWIKKHYNKELENAGWLSAYDSDFKREEFENVDTFKNVTILQGVENYIKMCIQPFSESDEIRKKFNEQCDIWLEWEERSAIRQLIIIGNDLSKGIVPIEKEDRIWRDLTGWCYQDLTTRSDRVDLIWYGISKRLK